MMPNYRRLRALVKQAKLASATAADSKEADRSDDYNREANRLMSEALKINTESMQGHLARQGK